jgi:hypothetical protein
MVLAWITRILLLGCLLWAPLSAQQAVTEASLLERPTVLKNNVGQVHQKITTPSAQAQAFYDQGLTYLHHYVWIEAARSFHEALRRRDTRIPLGISPTR